MDPNHIVAVVGGGLVTAATAWKMVAVPIWRGVRRVNHFLDDWSGRGEQPGVMDRLAAVEHDVSAVRKEVHPNGGSSLRDAVDRVDRKLDDHIAATGGDR